LTTQEFVNAVILKATGKRTILAPTDTKFLKVLGIANGYIDQWQNEKDVDWSSLYDGGLSFGTVTATDTFAIPATVRKISDTRGDQVRIVWTDGVSYTDFEVVPADTLKRYPNSNVCAQIGTNIVFARTFNSEDPEFGGDVQVPVYTFAPTLVSGTPATGETDVVPVDIPAWLVTASAAEYVRNDITKQNQYGNLVNEANQLMERMKDDNDGQVSEPYMPWGPMGQTW
jgi:hypothetical protein